MSRSPHFFLERFNTHTNKYELEHPLIWNYNRTNRETADLFPYNGTHELFAIVEQHPKHFDYPAMKGIHSGLPPKVSKEVLEAYKNCSSESGFDDTKNNWTPEARWFTYADMYIYFLEHPKVIDYETSDDTEVDNPITLLKNRVDSFLNTTDLWNWEDDYSLIRIVYWIM